MTFLRLKRFCIKHFNYAPENRKTIEAFIFYMWFILAVYPL